MVDQQPPRRPTLLDTSLAHDSRTYSHELALLFGRNEAILLSQLHYWLRRTRHIREGRYCRIATYQQWHEEDFADLSITTIKNALTRLHAKGVVLKRQFGAREWKHHTWWSIHYERLNILVEEQRSGVIQLPARRERQDKSHLIDHPNFGRSSGQKTPDLYLEHQQRTAPENPEVRGIARRAERTSAKLHAHGHTIELLSNAIQTYLGHDVSQKERHALVEVARWIERSGSWELTTEVLNYVADREGERPFAYFLAVHKRWAEARMDNPDMSVEELQQLGRLLPTNPAPAITCRSSGG